MELFLQVITGFRDKLRILPNISRYSSPLSLLIRYNIPTHLEEQHLPSNKQEPPPFFHLDTSPVLDHVLVHSINKIHVLVVTVELIWLLFFNILSFNFVATPNKSFRFTKFRRSYVNRPAVVVANHCQSYTAFSLDMRCTTTFLFL